MKRTLFIAGILLFLVSCKQSAPINNIKVANINELNKAIKNSHAGDNIILANGIWKDVQIKFYGEGTKENPITLSAEEKVM